MKLILKLIAGLVVILIAAVSVALIMLDTEKLKPELQKLAAEQGIVLNLDGDIGISIYPSLGLGIDQVTIDALNKSTPNEPPLLKVGRLNFSLEVMPLLAGEIKVAVIELENTAIFAKIDENGRGNWEDLQKPENAEQASNPTPANTSQTPESPKTDPSNTSSQAINLNAELIRLSNATLNFSDVSQNLAVSVEPLNLSLTGFNLDDRPFEVLLDWVVNYQQGKSQERTLIDNSGNISMQVSVNSEGIAKLINAQLTTKTSGKLPGLEIQEQEVSLKNINLTGQPIALTSNWQLNLTDPSMAAQGKLSTDITLNAKDMSGSLSGQVSPKQVTLDKLTLTNKLSANTATSTQNLAGKFVVKEIDQEHPHLSGDLTLSTMNARELMKVLAIPLETNNPKALEKLSAQLSFEQQANKAEVNNLAITLDSSEITGFIRIDNIEAQAITGEINIDTINIDDYLAPSTDAEPKPTQTANSTPASTKPIAQKPASINTSSNEPDIIPIKLLRELDLDITFIAGELIANKLKFENLTSQVDANNGLVKLSRLSSDFYQGQFTASADIDARQAQAKISQAGNFSGIAIEPLLTDLELDNEYKLKGLVAGTLDFKSAGNKQSQLMKALNGQMTLSGQQLLLAPLNIEKQYCQIVALVEGGNKRAEINAIDWPDTTKLRDFDATIRVKDMSAQIRQLQSGVENIQAGANGLINLASESFDIRIPVTLTADKTSAEGCKINSSFIKGRELDLIRCQGKFAGAAGACGLDKDAASDLLEAYAKHEARKALKKQEDKLKEKLGEEGGSVVNDLLNKWLN